MQYLDALNDWSKEFCYSWEGYSLTLNGLSKKPLFKRQHRPGGGASATSKFDLNVRDSSINRGFKLQRGIYLVYLVFDNKEIL